MPLHLTEQCGADVAVFEELIEPVAVEQPRRGGRGGRRQQEPRSRRTMLLADYRIGIDALAEAERAGDEIQIRRDVTGVANLLRPLPLPRGVAETVVTGTATKSRSFDGFQSQ